MFWSAISCGSELIVGAFVQEVQQTSFSDTRYIQDVSWMAVSHILMCDEMSILDCLSAGWIALLIEFLSADYVTIEDRYRVHCCVSPDTSISICKTIDNLVS